MSGFATSVAPAARRPQRSATTWTTTVTVAWMSVSRPVVRGLDVIRGSASLSAVTPALQSAHSARMGSVSLGASSTHAQRARAAPLTAVLTLARGSHVRLIRSAVKASVGQAKTAPSRAAQRVSAVALRAVSPIRV